MFKPFKMLSLLRLSQLQYLNVDIRNYKCVLFCLLPFEGGAADDGGAADHDPYQGDSGGGDADGGAEVDTPAADDDGRDADHDPHMSGDADHHDDGGECKQEVLEDPYQ